MWGMNLNKGHYISIVILKSFEIQSEMNEYYICVGKHIAKCIRNVCCQTGDRSINHIMDKIDIKIALSQSFYPHI